MVKEIDNFRELAEDYQLFLFDIFGVIHDGINLYQNTVEFIEHLQKVDKQVYLVSNMPRPAKIAEANLEAKGFTFPKEKIITSGDHFLHFLNTSPQKFSTQKIYHLGKECNHDLFQDQTINHTETIENADLLFISYLTTNEDELFHCDDIFKRAAELNIPAYCANPDLTAPRGNGLCYTPGTFAQRYKEFGGLVHFFGKPYKEFYEYCFEIIKPDPQDKILMIGDSLKTDIRGATNSGIDSLLILSGIHRNNHFTIKQLNEISENEGYSLTYAIKSPHFT